MVPTVMPETPLRAVSRCLGEDVYKRLKRNPRTPSNSVTIRTHQKGKLPALSLILCGVYARGCKKNRYCHPMYWVKQRQRLMLQHVERSRQVYVTPGVRARPRFR